MIYSQTLTGLHILIDVVGLPGNLLVITTIFMESRFRTMRYILLASLATSDFLFLILGNSLNIVSASHERWLYGEMICTLHIAATRYFYLNTVLHFIAVSYERYSAIVKSPLTYDGSVTTSRVVVIVLIWALPGLLTSALFLFNSGSLLFVFNIEVPFCKAAIGSLVILVFASCALFVVPFTIIVYLNWRVFKTANALQTDLVAAAQLGSLERSNLTEREQIETRRIRDCKAAIDVCIIIAAFLLCYLPEWTTNTLYHLKRETFPLEIIPITRFVFYASALTNPVIYSIRKREFRVSVKRMLFRIGRLCGATFARNNAIVVASLTTHDHASPYRTPSQAGF